MNFKKIKLALPLVLSLSLVSCGEPVVSSTSTNTDTSEETTSSSTSSSDNSTTSELSLIEKLNISLKENEETYGKPSTMYDMLLQLKSAGFSIEGLESTLDNGKFVWDELNNVLSIVSNEVLQDTINPNQWVIVYTSSELDALNDNYSIYLSDSFSYELSTYTFVNGFDTGNYEGFLNLTLQTNKEVNLTLRSDGANINFDAENADVKHYGYSHQVNIEAISMNSYHEFGTADVINLLKGHLVLENDSTVSEIYIDEEATFDSILIEASDLNTKIIVPIGKEDQFLSVISGGTLINASDLIISGIDGYGTKFNPYLINNKENFDAILNTNLEDTYATLLSDIDFGTLDKPSIDSGLISINSEEKLSIDLNGFDITGTLYSDSSSYARAHIILNSGTLNLFNSNLEEDSQVIDLSTTSYSCTRAIKNTATGVLNIDNVSIRSTNSVAILNLGTATLKDCNIESLNTTTGGGGWDNSTTAIENREGGKLDIYNCYVSSKTRAALFCDAYGDAYLNVYSGEFYGHESYGAINGGSENVVHLYGGKYNSNVKEYVYLDTCYLAYEEGMYVVYKRNEASEIVVSNEEELISAINSATEQNPVYAIINNKVDLNSSILIPDGCKIIVNGTLNLESNAYISNIENLEISESGKIEGVVNFEDNTYKIYDAMDFQWLAFIADENTQIKVEIMNDIVFPLDCEFYNINVLTGEIKGNNHTISNINVESNSANVGIFQYLIDVNIHDINFENITVISTTGYTGGIVGMIVGSSNFENINITGNVNVSGASYGVAAFAGSINDNSNSTNNFINCVSDMNLNCSIAYNVGTIYGTSSGSLTNIGIYNCTNNGNITAAGSVGIVFGYGGLANGSSLEIIGFVNAGVVKAGNNVVTSYLGAASSGTIYNDDYADGSKYQAVKTEDGWTHQNIEL